MSVLFGFASLAVLFPPTKKIFRVGFFLPRDKTALPMGVIDSMGSPPFPSGASVPLELLDSL